MSASARQATSDALAAVLAKMTPEARQQYDQEMKKVAIDVREKTRCEEPLTVNRKTIPTGVTLGDTLVFLQWFDELGAQSGALSKNVGDLIREANAAIALEKAEEVAKRMGVVLQ